MNIENLKEDLDRLNKPLIDGNYNLCYGDGYYAKSLVDKYGKSIIELTKIVNNIEKEETIKEASYKYNIGFEEMVNFYQKASSSELIQMQKIIKKDNWTAFKKLIKNVLGVNLKG